MFEDPVTDEQWQDCVNLIWALETIDSARQYGLITGGPTMNRDRCDELLSKARAKGIVPDQKQVDAVLAIIIHHRSSESSLVP